jgi:hypothetical protein
MEIAIEDHVGGRPLSLHVEIHEQERKVVQRIDGGERLVELEGVIGRRPPVMHDYVRQVQVTVAAADEAVRGAFVDDGRGALQLPLQRAREARRRVWLEHIGGGQAAGQRCYQIAKRSDAGRWVGPDRRAVGCEHRLREPHRQIAVELAPLCPHAEEIVLVEPPHVRGPFDGLAVAAQSERAVRPACYGHAT